MIKPKIEDVARLLYGGRPFLETATTVRYGGRGSLAIDKQKQCFHDFEAGIGGDVFTLVMHERGLDFKGAKAWLGLPPEKRITPTARPTTQMPVDRSGQIEKAKKLFDNARPIWHTLAHDYLVYRRISPAQVADDDMVGLAYFNNTFKYQPRCATVGVDGFSIEYHPALLCAIRDYKTKKFIGVQRIFLDAITKGKANIPLPKKILGNSKGGGVFLSPYTTGAQGLVEGVEDGLSLVQMGIGVPIVCVLSKMKLMDYVDDFCDNVHIFLDNDADVGEFSSKIKERYKRPGRSVELYTSPVGKDMNDYVKNSNDD